VVEHDPEDRRVRCARRTEAGAKEVELLDERSDQLAASLLEPLSEHQRTRLVDAMTEVERLLTAALVEIEPTDPEHPHARHCLGEYAKELDRRFAGGFDPARSTLPDPGELRPPGGLLLVATLRGEPIGCGGLLFHDGAATEIKRMWVDPAARGLGVGRRLLAELEARAAERDPVVRLDTNAALTEAIAMYRATGYREIAAFNEEVHASHWFEKRLRP
jgi:ribosomal protein S18 acetylase RimI-like enzyme